MLRGLLCSVLLLSTGSCFRWYTPSPVVLGPDTESENGRLDGRVGLHGLQVSSLKLRGDGTRGKHWRLHGLYNPGDGNANLDDGKAFAILGAGLGRRHDAGPRQYLETASDLMVGRLFFHNDWAFYASTQAVWRRSYDAGGWGLGLRVTGIHQRYEQRGGFPRESVTGAHLAPVLVTRIGDASSRLETQLGLSFPLWRTDYLGAEVPFLFSLGWSRAR